MHIQFNTDSSVEGRDSLFARIRPDVEKALARFAEHITRLEIHVTDVNAHKGGDDDLRAVVEVRREGKQPITATNTAPSAREAVKGATEKVARALDSDIGKARARRQH